MQKDHNLLNAASVNKSFETLVKDEKEKRQDLQGIFADGVYFILGKSVETTTRDLFGIYYSKARNVPQQEIINATPARGNKVDVYRTLEEAKHMQQASHVYSGNMTDPDTMPVIFAVKLKANQLSIPSSSNKRFPSVEVSLIYLQVGKKRRLNMQHSTWGFSAELLKGYLMQFLH
ncbi:hypothetical protein BN59_01138 [Legionella massiliensis]|uniref:Uncharacterized protein n=1 Tax=Legionella massiliensis TaxID=1034943 RepID=A0A078KV42_9GAMM|nr:hypothetical protein [Legionella massiliensis]CDZ76862.1 hypothetical protein BN59_01138 [Legionella massiliensis]CEE12600.1 hypothetical protein BN1094_01138 [Legionella massiliensis]